MLSACEMSRIEERPTHVPVSRIRRVVHDRDNFQPRIRHSLLPSFASSQIVLVPFHRFAKAIGKRRCRDEAKALAGPACIDAAPRLAGRSRRIPPNPASIGTGFLHEFGQLCDGNFLTAAEVHGV